MNKQTTPDDERGTDLGGRVDPLVRAPDSNSATGCCTKDVLLGIDFQAKGSPYVYIALCNDASVKIGITNRDPKKRLLEIQRTSGKLIKRYCLVTALNNRTLELWLHRKFSDLRLTGEWFSGGQELFLEASTEAKRMAIGW